VNALLLSIGFGLVAGCVVAIGAVGFTLQFGTTNVLNLAYGSVMTVAAFIAYLLTRASLGIWVALPLAAVCAGVFSLLLNRLVYAPFARRGVGLFGMVIVTISVQLAIYYGLQAAFGTPFMSYQGVGPGATYHAAGMVFTQIQLIMMGIALGAMLVVYALLSFTKLGKAMRATAANPALARSAGIPTGRIVDLAWLFSGALCGASGVTLALDVQGFDFSLGQEVLVVIIAAAVLGGIGHPYGAMLGALVVGVSSSVVANYTSAAYNQVTALVILIAVLLLRPRGIFATPAAGTGPAAATTGEVAG
jgi:branched-chain amino acid transport system permease protein/neutral amino acid transport system permease protein